MIGMIVCWISIYNIRCETKYVNCVERWSNWTLTKFDKSKMETTVSQNISSNDETIKICLMLGYIKLHLGMRRNSWFNTDWWSSPTDIFISFVPKLLWYFIDIDGNSWPIQFGSFIPCSTWALRQQTRKWRYLTSFPPKIQWSNSMQDFYIDCIPIIWLLLKSNDRIRWMIFMQIAFHKTRTSDIGAHNKMIANFFEVIRVLLDMWYIHTPQ